MTNQYPIDVRQSVIFPNFSQERLLVANQNMHFVEPNPDKPELNIED
jgi:hypothetical protein